jgi:type VI secretion system protein ImpE
MTAREFYQAGRLREAVQAVSEEVRADPADHRKRTFLFELLCFAGEYHRAEKHLVILGEGGPQAEMGALVYRGAIQAERQRQDLFQSDNLPQGISGDGSTAGTLDGRPFKSLGDADPRIGARLEVYAGGNYVWVPFAQIASLEMSAPQKLRDLLWIPATVHLGAGMKGKDLGQVLLPALSPFTWRHADDSVRLGRQTVWTEEGGETVPYGQKALLVDGEEVPLLEVREVIFGGA